MTVAGATVAFETLATGFAFCEAPRTGDDGTAFFSDLTGGGYHAWDPDGRMRTVLADRMWIGGAVFDESGAIVLGGKGGLVMVDPASGDERTLLDAIAGHSIVAVNDIEADAHGHLFGGTIDFAAIFSGGTPAPGLFFRLDAAGEVVVLRDDVVASNGIGFSPDGAWLYHSESTIGVWRWKMGDDGLPFGQELIVEVADCDGLAVDCEGSVWIACWEKAELRRYRPDGTLDRRMKLPFASVTSLAFGGPDLTELFVTTAGHGTSRTGGLIRLNPGVAGLPVHKSRL
ncbi:calcium-binding protein [Sphingomonas sp. DBB INV C78]|uniref:SMP-30/gluconolactonase/LRE family protein n=1 Tax=Sphingomonas sp. DBB INV C78 TaxID=3349434 RepID=UPI0036D20CEB